MNLYKYNSQTSTFHKPFIQTKVSTLYQQQHIYTKNIQKNTQTLIPIYLLPIPLKIYRKELSFPTQNTPFFVINAKDIGLRNDTPNNIDYNNTNEFQRNALKRVRNNNMYNCNNNTIKQIKKTYLYNYSPNKNIANVVVPPSSDYLQYYTKLQPITPPTSTNLSNITNDGSTLTNLLLVKSSQDHCCQL
jgi:hypothetical protein